MNEARAGRARKLSPPALACRLAGDRGGASRLAPMPVGRGQRLDHFDHLHVWSPRRGLAGGSRAPPGLTFRMVADRQLALLRRSPFAGWRDDRRGAVVHRPRGAADRDAVRGGASARGACRRGGSRDHRDRRPCVPRDRDRGGLDLGRDDGDDRPRDPAARRSAGAPHRRRRARPAHRPGRDRSRARCGDPRARRRWRGRADRARCERRRGGAWCGARGGTWG